MAAPRPYYAERGLSAAFYDTVAGADADILDDLSIYASLATPGGAILELGAGTGRLALALAARGFQVAGVEIAPAMLAQANAKRSELEPALAQRIEFRRGDMASVDLNRTFDLVICPYFALSHLPCGVAWKNTFAVTARHLRPGGRAAFHLPRLETLRLPPCGDPDAPFMDEPTPSGGRLRLYMRERIFEADESRLDQVVEYREFDARGQVLRSSLERLAYYWADPAPLAAQHGLTSDRAPIGLGGSGEIHVFVKA